MGVLIDESAYIVIVINTCSLKSTLSSICQYLRYLFLFWIYWYLSD